MSPLTAPPPPPVSINERVAIALFIALVGHALLILGISFDFDLGDKREREAPPAIEVTLANSADDSRPTEADYLAQANQQGSGNTQVKERPQSPPQALPEINPNPGNAQQTRPAAVANHVIKPPEKEILTADEATTQVHVGEETPVDSAATPSAAELIRRSMEMARLEAELSEVVSVFSKREREKLLVPNTMSHAEAAYLDAWQKKVELIGNMNYPDKARKEKLSGDLLLMVAINADGSLARVELLRSSGHKVLDDAAMRIVKLASPYPPLPEAIQEYATILKIPRTWKFMAGNRLKTQ